MYRKLVKVHNCNEYYVLGAFFSLVEENKITVKPVLSCRANIDKTKVLKKNGSLMKVESIAEC